MRHLLASAIPADLKAGKSAMLANFLRAFGYQPEKGFR